MESLYAKYRERIKAQKVAIWVEAQMRAAREKEAMARPMVRRRAETEKLERVEAARIKAERRSEAKEARISVESRAAAE